MKTHKMVFWMGGEEVVGAVGTGEKKRLSMVRDISTLA